MTDYKNRLLILWIEERRLNREWEVVAGREDWTEAAKIRMAYNRMFSELVSLCRRLDIIE